MGYYGPSFPFLSPQMHLQLDGPHHRVARPLLQQLPALGHVGDVEQRDGARRVAPAEHGGEGLLGVVVHVVGNELHGYRDPLGDLVRWFNMI